MKSLVGTKTKVNLMKAFAGESQARSRYTMYAKVAEKEGYRQIANIFAETAENEYQHAKRFFNFLVEGLGEELPAGVEITAEFPVAKDDTIENLRAAAAGENEEWTDLYPAWADIAQEEGFPEIAAVWRKIADVEERHEARFLKLKENVEKGIVFEREESREWICQKCGYIHTGPSAIKMCPSCAHPQSYFELFVENY
ncbi:MAG: rubrerythrin family protein [Clostridiales bacterium]|nr:rubrerythrin family protein [Clostridiales bacterium]